MKVFETNKKVILNAGETHVQTISSKNIAKATYFLRDKIYSDKLKAAVTETLSNAIDEHRKHNVQRPVDVFMFDTEVVIRDYAQGLSNDGVFGTFFQYFESTKSDNNHDIGGFGIGAKAPSAYNPEFYVISFYNGVKTVYCSVVDGYESKASVVHSAEYHGIFPTGIAVRIPFLAESVSADKKKTLEILHDLFVQIGQNAAPEFNVYSMVHEDYDSFNDDVVNETIVWDRNEQVWKNVGKGGALVILSKRASWCCDRQLFRGILKTGGEEVSVNIDKDGNLKFNPMIVLCEDSKKFCLHIGDDIILARTGYDRWGERNENSLLAYPFWGAGGAASLLAYDGDLCYHLPVQMPDKIAISSDLRVIVKFKRGELPITPSRESIENIAQVNGYVTRKVKHALELFTKACCQAFTNALNDAIGKPTCLAIMEGLSEFVDNMFYSDSRGRNSKSVIALGKNELNPRDVVSYIPYYGQATCAFDLKDRYLKVRIMKTGGHDPKVTTFADNRIGAYTTNANNIGHIFLVLPEDAKAKNKVNYTKLFDGIMQYITQQGVILNTKGGRGAYFIGTVTQDTMDEILALSPSMPKLLRYGIDIFKIEDIAKAYDIARTIPVVEHIIVEDGTKKKRAPIPVGLKDLRNDLDIPASQYGSTLLIQASTFVSADFQYTIKRYGDIGTLNALLALTGKSRIASVRKEKIKTFTAAGCVLLSDDMLQQAREAAPTWRYLDHYIYTLANQLGLNSQTVRATITKAGADKWLFANSSILKTYLMASNVFGNQLPPCWDKCSSISDKAYGNLLLKLVSLATKEELLYLPFRRCEEQANLAYVLDDVLKVTDTGSAEVKKLRKELSDRRSEYAQATEVIKASLKAKFTEALMFTISQLENNNKNN